METTSSRLPTRQDAACTIRIPEGAKPEDPFICTLDPAVGTGTFLFECIEVIERTMKTKWARELRMPNPDDRSTWRDPQILRRWQDYVPKHLLPRLYGYELIMAPYAIAHLKLALKLGETGYRFREGDRLHIYLTNSLEPPSEVADSKLADLFATLATEAQEVNEIKANKRFTVVIGNPPYSVGSQNKSAYIERLLEDYKKAVRGSSNIQPLSDDYIKFLRLFQELTAQSGVGVVGVVTNNVFLDGLMHRGIRTCMTEAYSDMWILNMHGNATIAERTPHGRTDDNVFDIKQGVCVTLCIRRYGGESCQVRSADLYGERRAKYEFLLSHDRRIARTPLAVSRPHAFFVSKDFSHEADYNEYMPLTDVMLTYCTGVATHRDKFLVDLDRHELRKRIEAFCSSSVEHASRDLGLSDTRDWSLTEAKRSVRQFDPLALRRYAYKAFSCHFIYYEPNLIDRGCLRIGLMKSMFTPNIGLVLRKKVTDPEWRHVFVTREMVDFNFYNYISVLFPLYLVEAENGLQSGASRRANLSGGIARWLSCTLNRPQASAGISVVQESTDVFLSYVYAVLHSPGYRSRYAEFLKIDFPRLPLTSSLGLFRALAKLGGELVALHLLESPKLDKPITEWRGATPSGEVEKVSYVKAASSRLNTRQDAASTAASTIGTIFIDKAQTQGFQGVPENVWNFHIGGYQVCEKWLKDRKGRSLSADDIAHYHKIVVALNETIRLMAEVDKVIEARGGCPGAFLTKELAKR